MRPISGKNNEYFQNVKAVNSTTFGLTRRKFLALTAGTTASAAISLAGCKAVCSKSKSTGEKPNILFIMADDLGPEWLSCYGAEEIQTPNLDKLAFEGMRFTNAYSMAQCVPTRATLLTGQYPCRNGWVNHWDVPRWGAGCHFDAKYNTTFARVLKKAGYKTAAAGKWQINDFRVQGDAMEKHGFDEYCMWTGFETGNPASAKRYWNPYIHSAGISKTYKSRFGTDVFVDFMIDFMKRNKDQPMLLYFPMALTHQPFVTTPLEGGVKGKIERHKAMVRYTDYAVGRLVKALEELKIRDNTVVFFTTDNGSGKSVNTRMNGRKVAGGKGTLGENGVRAPFIVNCPGLVPAGVVTDALTDFTDMMPTFAQLAWARIPDDVVIDGHSIAPLILGRQKDSMRKWIMSMGFGPAKLFKGRVVPVKEYGDRTIRDKRYKLWVENGKSTKLFDVIGDPGESNNLIESQKPAIVSARKKLDAAVKSFPVKDRHPKYDPTPAQIWDIKSSP